MFKNLRLKYWKYQVNRLTDKMDLCRGIHNVSGKRLEEAGNIMYLESKYKRDYYIALLQLHYPYGK